MTPYSWNAIPSHLSSRAANEAIAADVRAHLADRVTVFVVVNADGTEYVRCDNISAGWDAMRERAVGSCVVGPDATIYAFVADGKSAADGLREARSAAAAWRHGHDPR